MCWSSIIRAPAGLRRGRRRGEPVVLRRTVPSWRAASMLDRRMDGTVVEARLNVHCWHQHPVPPIPRRQGPGGLGRAAGRSEVGSFLGQRAMTCRVAWTPRSAWAGTGRCLAGRSRAPGRAPEGLVGGRPANRTGSGPGRCAPMGRWSSSSGVPGLVVHTTGPFAEVPGLSRVRGEGLTIRVPGLQLPGIVHRGVFLLPQGGDLFRSAPPSPGTRSGAVPRNRAGPGWRNG